MMVNDYVPTAEKSKGILALLKRLFNSVNQRGDIGEPLQLVIDVSKILKALLSNSNINNFIISTPEFISCF